MPSINLIAARRDEKRRLEINARRMLYAITAEVGALILVASVETAHLMQIKQHTSEIEATISSLKPKVDHIQDLQKRMTNLQPKLTALNEARNDTLYWYTAVQTVVACLPTQSSIDGITSAGDPTPPAPAPTTATAGAPPAPAAPNTGPSLSFSGAAASSDDIGMAMMRMNQFQNIASVSLGGVTRSTSTQGPKEMTFTMQVQMKPTTAQDVTTPGIASESAQPAAAAPAAPATPQAVAAVPSTTAAKDNSHA